MKHAARAVMVCAMGSGLLLHLPANADAQTIRGAVSQAETGDPLGGVRVWLLSREGNELSLSVTEPDGSFRVRPDDPGEYRLRVVRIGFLDHETDVIEIGEDEEVEIEISLTPDPVRLPGVAVEVDRLPSFEIHRATYTGLYMRRGDNRWATPGGNRVFVRDDLESLTGMTVWEFIQQHAPMQILTQLRGERRYQRDVRRAGLLGQRTPQRMGSCPLPAFYVRGLNLGGATSGTDLNPLVELYLEMPLREIEGVEFYRRSDMAPLEFRESHSCGVVVIWPRQAGVLR